MDSWNDLVVDAQDVLDKNYTGDYTIPAPGVYPHQWLWDSCFIAIGTRHLDVSRAKSELTSLVSSQWHNGMIPHMRFNSAPSYLRDRLIWNSAINPRSPDGIATSGITQPPMLAEAVYRVGMKLPKAERHSWYHSMYPHIVSYHQWLYAERDPHNEGLVLQIHPWESGLDNTPPWMNELHLNQLPIWIKTIDKLKLGPLVSKFRTDTHRIPAGQRIDIIDALGLFSNQRTLRRKKYDINNILRQSLFSIEDLTFNCIFIRANQHLRNIAKSLRVKLPEGLEENMLQSENALEKLWDPHTGQYYSRDFVSHRLLKEQSVATLMPLYTGVIPKERAEQLVRLIENQHLFGAPYPVPSVPLSSEWFDPSKYWQGPTWINTNWLVVDGLRRMGFEDHATALKLSTIDLVIENGIYEYYNPQTGESGGAKDFSWTASLVVDLIHS